MFEKSQYALILVDYNSLDKTIDYAQHCLDKIGTVGARRVVIVENGDLGNSLELLTNQYGVPVKHKCPFLERDIYNFQTDLQQIVFCHSGENLGYAKGNNMGCRIADEFWGVSYYIISNNDLVFDKNIDIDIVNSVFAEKSEVAVIGPNVFTPSGEQQSPRIWQSAFVRLFLQYWILTIGGLLGRKRQKKLYKKFCAGMDFDAETGNCDWVSGCFFFMRAEDFRKIGGFDENTFLYAEEMILAKRFERIGKSIYFCKEIEVIHKHAQTTSKALALSRVMEVDFKSNCYFYKNYIGKSKIYIFFAKINFKLFIGLFKLKQKLKRR